VLPVNHVQALGPAHSPDFRDKKSRSTLRLRSGQALQLADLLVELFDQCLLVLVRLPSALVKELGRSFNQGLLPGMDLGGVDFKPAGDFRDGLVSLERGQGYPSDWLKTGFWP
jgi:hypothetical protein